MNIQSAQSCGTQGEAMKPFTPATTALFRLGRKPIEQLAILALMLTFGAAAAYAHDEPVKMIFSGTSENSATSLQQPDTSNDGDNFAGESTLGSFTVRNIRAISNFPGTSPSCAGANQLFFSESAGWGCVPLPGWQPARSKSHARRRLH